MQLTDRTVLITGGSGGIDLAFALKLIELGNEVIVTGRRESVLDEEKKRHPKLRFRAYTVCAYLLRRQGSNPLLYTVAAVPIGGNWR